MPLKTRRRLNANAGDRAIAAGGTQLRHDRPALLDRNRAAGMKDAAARRMERAWNLALERDRRTLGFERRVGNGHRGEQGLRVGMKRVRIEIFWAQASRNSKTTPRITCACSAAVRRGSRAGESRLREAVRFVAFLYFSVYKLFKNGADSGQRETEARIGPHAAPEFSRADLKQR